MKVSTLQILGLKGFFDSGEIELSAGINLLVGPNNSGKSTIIQALHKMQNPLAFTYGHTHRASHEITIKITIAELNEHYCLPVAPRREYRAGESETIDVVIHVNAGSEGYRYAFQEGNIVGGKPISNREPHNFIYPYLSKRKVGEYSELINSSMAESVTDDLRSIASRVDCVGNPQHRAYSEFDTTCREIIGFSVSALPSENGKKVGILVSDHQSIPLESMGEGVPHVLGLLTSLSMAEGNLFLIEEIENDLHPKALKKLLEFIGKKSSRNQFVISTHSNIVVKNLGALPNSRIFGITSEWQGRIPVSTCRLVGNDPASRMAILEDLGYELGDFGIWKGWLFLEESSAERLIREYLIPWFAPNLVGKLRTIAANGVDAVEPRFDAFNNLFLFVHLEDIYRNCAWVVLDGDEAGVKVTESFRCKYRNSWREDRFLNFSKSDFEHYYPVRYSRECQEALEISDKQAKRAEKKALLDRVIVWIEQDHVTAKEEFETSAAEVIEILQMIEKTLR